MDIKKKVLLARIVLHSVWIIPLSYLIYEVFKGNSFARLFLAAIATSILFMVLVYHVLKLMDFIKENS